MIMGMIVKFQINNVIFSKLELSRFVWRNDGKRHPCSQGTKEKKQKILDYMGSTELAAKQKHQFEFILLSMKNLAYLDWLCSACLKRILCHLDENSHDSDQLLKAHHHRGI